MDCANSFLIKNKFFFFLLDSRCQLNSQWCYEHKNQTNLHCTINKPIKYVYSFISLPGRRNKKFYIKYFFIKNLAQIQTLIEIFRIRNSQLNVNQYVEYSLQLINENNSTKIVLDNFQLKISRSRNAHLIIIKELNTLEEIQLHIQMKIFTNKILTSISIMKLFIYISQYNFHL